MMKRMLTATLACTLAMMIATVPASATQLPDPILHYGFENAANMGLDDSGNGHHLNISGSTNSLPGPVGNASEFLPHDNGGQDGAYTSTSGMNYPGAGGLTLAFWVKLESTTNGSRVGDYWEHRCCGESFGSSINFSNREISFFVRTGFSGPSGISEVTFDDAGVQEGDWVHVTGVFDPNGNVNRLYINGVQRSTYNMPGSMRTQSAPNFYVASSWHSTQHLFVDEVYLFDTALTPQQIETLAGGSQEVPEPATMLASLAAIAGIGRYLRKRK